MPENESRRRWWNKAWELGIESPSDRTFVVEDRENDNKILAFSRWQVPQEDGNLERRWPELNSDEWDVEVAKDFFEGTEANRKAMMDGRPHWCMLQVFASTEVPLTLIRSP